MNLISIKEACSLIKVPDSTLRDWIENGSLEKHKDEKGFICVDKRQVLKLVPTIITYYNYKGGVSKSSLSIMTSDFYEKQDEKILLVDFDPQANLSRTFFRDEEMLDENNNYKPTLYDFFNERKPLNKILQKYNKNIDILPSRLEMMEKAYIKDFDLIDYKDEFYNLFKKYSIVIIDCPPALNAFTTMGLLLANYVFIPFVPEPFTYDGLISMLKSMQKIAPYNKDYIDYRILYSRIKGQKIVIHENYMDAINIQMKDNIFQNKIPEFVGIVERGSVKKNIFDMYMNDKSIDKIKDVFLEMDKYIFEERSSK
ncbi:MAG: hypothetical protein A2086_01755 [Spirochaetes bacterium GWD1_27_9]|nr:MAG: hypothetical protein A2Z98_03975 [Spirochaetes bacterium GWB1_27_13]OHD20605.1 MAG: hypothetical protein A2Y34_17455 [Spirochaetes bacterium GWC1_27_15]OHD41828.1 MAG: hypothetical protein A2086_01755 [Spirochaetes bacterium GWD1_27_9]